jgi:hypothetical protein
MYHTSLGTSGVMVLNSTSAVDTGTANYWGSSAPTSTVFGVYPGGFAANNVNGASMVAYCWAQVAGFSQFGSYTANASADGPFIYTGFRPSFVMFKKSSGVGDWLIVDNKRDTYNVELNYLLANSSQAEAS